MNKVVKTFALLMALAVVFCVADVYAQDVASAPTAAPATAVAAPASSGGFFHVI